MTNAYDKYYQHPDYFGVAYPELIDFFQNFKFRGKLLDMGCGQGRDAIPLARLGFEVTGIDSSKVGVEQVNHVAEREGLGLLALKADIYSYEELQTFDFILFDNMFHFYEKDIEKEVDLIHRSIRGMKSGAHLVICMQDSENKVKTLIEELQKQPEMTLTAEIAFDYSFQIESGRHQIDVLYKLLCAQKL